MRRIVPILFGLLGTAILVSLGFWQLERLEWKTAIIARVEERIAADPAPLPSRPDPVADEFMPVAIEGRVDGRHLRVLGAWRGGTGFRIVAPFETGGTRIMVDLGIVPLENEHIELPRTPVEILGNLAWPDETGPSTPVPSADLWYSRDVPAMASYLGTEPILVVARQVEPPLGPVPAPVGTEGLTNNHLGYAVQWFGLALVWAGMAGYFVWRQGRGTA